MSSQVSTSTEGESEIEIDCDFDFDAWIKKYELTEIKELFIKHNATSLSTLTLSSSQFQKLMVDPILFTKPVYIQKILSAMQHLSLSHITYIIPYIYGHIKSSVTMLCVVYICSRVVISDEEQKVIDDIEMQSKCLSQIDQEISELGEELPKSITRIKQEKLKKIKIMEAKINRTCNNIIDAVKTKQNSVLNQLNQIKINVNQQDTLENDEKKIRKGEERT